MNAAGQQLGLRLFLEGVEVPVVAAQVQIGINSPATASIQVVPGDRITELKARTMVHVFFRDYTLDNEPSPLPPDADRVADQYGITVEEAKDLIADNPDLFATTEQAELRGYKLLFAGEVIGVVYMKTPAGRQAVLQCSDFSTYWDTTYQFFVSYSPGGNFLGTSAAVWAGGESMFDDLTGGHVSVMNEYLRSKPKTPGLQNVKGLMGGIISLLEAMGGVPRHTHGVNDFFTIAELKNHILQQIVAEQNDDTAQRLFDEKTFMDWLSRGMSSLGQLATFRDMMKLLFKYVYYEIVPNPAAMYVRSKRAETKTKRVTSTTKVELSPELQNKLRIFARTVDRWATISQNEVDAQLEERGKAKSDKQLLKSIIDSPDFPRLYKTKLETAYIWFDKIINSGGSVHGTDRVFNTAGGTSRASTVIGEVNIAIFLDNRKAWGKIRDILQKTVGSQIILSSTRNVVNRKPEELDRLHSQIFRPDCFFAAAPRCNVIFPDQYTQFQFSRNYLQEVTRLRLSVDWLFGGDSGGLLAEYHFAPSTKDIKRIAKQQGNNGIRALLPWEIYSGILPKFETIHEMNYIAGRGERARGIKGNLRGPAVSYPQRTANFNYMKYRFAARTCEISAKFNPFLVCGFPAVLIERPFIVEPETALQIREGILNKGTDDIGEFVRRAAVQLNAPKQYLGMIAALSHSVAQDSAATSVVLTHARTHRITDDDFLNIFSEEITKELETKIVTTVLDFDEIIKRGDARLLKFLKDATPQDLDKQAQTAEEEQIELEDSDTSPPIEDRPNTAPSIDQVPALAQFGALLAPTPAPKQTRVGVDVEPTKREGINANGTIAIRGKVKKDRLKNSRQTILVPDPGGTLRIGAQGPNKGKIVQVECLTDAAVGVIATSRLKKFQSGQKAVLTSDTFSEFEQDPQSGKLVLKKNLVDNLNVVYYWKRIAIHEEVKTSAKVTKLLPVEEGLRPPWFSPLYSNWFIGKDIYEAFLGCGSVVDQALFTTGEGAASFGTGRAAQQEILDKLKAAGNDRKQVLQILEDAKAKKISDVPDVESSVDALAYVYGEVRRLGLDVHRFVHDYTRRPIATMEDILGSDDLEYRVSGTKLELVKGTPGFHSTAIAPYDKLLGLLDNPDLELSRLRKGAGKKSPVSINLDPRPGRRAKVLEYLQEINAASGSLGVGVEG